MKVAGYERLTDWPRLGPSILIATALIVAIRTAKWAAKTTDAHCSDVDHELDREVSFAGRIMHRVIHSLVTKNSSMFPQVNVPYYEACSDEEDNPK